ERKRNAIGYWTAGTNDGILADKAASIAHDISGAASSTVDSAFALANLSEYGIRRQPRLQCPPVSTVCSDNPILVGQRGTSSDRNRFLTCTKVNRACDHRRIAHAQIQAPLLEAANEHHSAKRALGEVNMFCTDRILSHGGSG